jgi:hypothetical protein
LEAETPVRLLSLEKQTTILQKELEMRQLQNQVKELEAAENLIFERARQDLRREILPLEQAPQMVAAASTLLHGTNLSIYGENSQLLSQLAPIFELLTRSLQQSVASAQPPAENSDDS